MTDSMAGIVRSEDCARCRWCCVFDRSDASWESPALSDALAARFETEVIDLPGGGKKRTFKLDFAEEGAHSGEAVCPARGPSGCTLADEKPFDCQVWPLRPMRLGEFVVLTTSPDCKPSLERPLRAFLELARGPLGERILEYGRQHFEELVEYKEGYPVLGCVGRHP
jgi:hypothetical protein